MDTTGNLIKLCLSSSNADDCVATVDAYNDVTLTGSAVMGDKVYGTVEIHKFIEANGVSYCILPKDNAK